MSIEKYECSFYVKPFDIDFEEAKKRVYMKYKNAPIDYYKAIEIYYKIYDAYFPWEFNFNPTILKERKNDFVVIGDGVRLGRINKSALPEQPHGGPSLADLLKDYYIYHIKTFVSYGTNFRLTKDEYVKYVRSDPHNRGYAEWAESKPPHICLDVIYGTKELTKVESYLLKKELSLKEKARYGSSSIDI